MQMFDLKLQDPTIIDQRTSELTKDNLNHPYMEYIFYNEKIYEKAKPLITNSSRAVLLKNEEEALAYKATQEMVIVDCPFSISQFQNTVSENVDFVIRCLFY